ncbi:phosphotransferase family protein [Mycobacterium eburneum]|nr:phosphotransferase family protein [Mycobacterium eburneum]TDH48011.1 phosphotransferase family protein [Mycobacterium eburneum]
MNAPAGVDLASLSAHLDAVGVARHGDLSAELLAGGRSNLTFLVSDGVNRWVLRRPPLHGVTPSAHDMAREYRVIAALRDSAVPVARAVTACNDVAVIGVPFQMVEFVPGRVVRSRSDLDALGSATVVSDCVDGLITVLAALHRVDPAAVGLADFARPTGYLERQVARWAAQWRHVRRDDDDRDRDADRLHAVLAAGVPRQSTTSIVHGDYRIDNTILDCDDPARVRAIVDWEMSTLGDPLADAALICVYRDPVFDAILGTAAAWTAPAMPSADELSHRYAVASERQLDHWAFYMALACYKLAVIAAGIEHRSAAANHGITGGTGRADRPGDAVAPLFARGISMLTHTSG